MPADRIGVLYLAPWVTIGGSDRNTVDWFRLIDKGRFRAFLVTTQESPNELFADAARYAEEAWALPELMAGAAMPRFIAEVIATRGIDVLHVMNSRLGFDLLPALKGAFPHLRTVVQLHAEEHPEGTGYPSYVAQRYDDFVDTYSVVSDFLTTRITAYGVSPVKQHVIRLGVDAQVFDPARVSPLPIERRDGELHVLFPVRLAWQKDPLLMVEVARRLADRGSGIVVHVVGDGELRGELEAAVAAHGVEDRVLLHGASLDMPAWYAATDVTLLTSRYEGVPLAIYESMAMGRPVVVADVGGSGEVVDDEVGFLIEQRDHPDDYVEALLRLERDAPFRHRLGTAAYERARRDFTVERMAREHERLYEDLVPDPGPRRDAVDLTPFDDWWAPDTAPLHLAVRTDPPEAVLTLEADQGYTTSVLVGRVLTRPLPGTVPLRPTAGTPRAEGDVLGHAFTAPLPGMVHLSVVLPGHLEGLWASVDPGTPPPCPVVGESLWVDAPFLLPEQPPAPSAQGRARPRRFSLRR